MQTKAHQKQTNEQSIKLYQKIAAFIEQFGYPPNYREMAVLMNLKSAASVQVYVRVLEKWHWIAFGNNKVRTLWLTRPTEIHVSEKIRQSVSEVSDRLGEQWAVEGNGR